MNLHICVGEVVEAQELFAGDMILIGDAGTGLALFLPVDEIHITPSEVVLFFEGGQHITVKPNTEVSRLEQGNNPFSDGHSGIRTGGAVFDGIHTPQR